jgi:hypothetical protein
MTEPRQIDCNVVVAPQSGNEINELAQEDDETFLRLSSTIARDWPRPIRDHVDNLLRQLHRRRALVPRSVNFVPILHGRDDPEADRELEKDITDLFESELSETGVVVSGESYSVPYDPETAFRAHVNAMRELDRALGGRGVVKDLRRDIDDTVGFERAIRGLATTRPGVRIGGFESRSGAIIATILERAPAAVGLSEISATEPKWRLGIEARTRQALNRAADHYGAVDLFFLAGGFHGPGVDNWCRRNNVPFQMSVSDVLVRKLPAYYGRHDN